MENKYFKKDAIISGFITNLGKYNEGELVGMWVSFPITEDEEMEILKEIGIGSVDEFGCPYEEIFFTDYEINMEGLSWEDFGEYASIETLNEAAEALESLNDNDLKKVDAIIEAGYTSSVMEAVNEIDDYNLMENVNDEYDLGYYWIEESGCYDIPEYIANYIDYESFGRDQAWDGCFTSYGFIERY